MAAVNNLDIIRTTVDMLFNFNSVQQNVFHTQYTGSTVSSDLVVSNAIRAELEGSLYTVVDVDMSILLAFTTYINFNVTQGVPMRDSVPTLVTAGLHVAEPLPLQIAALLSFPTGTAKSIGRKYIGSYTESATLGQGVIEATPLGRLVTAAANLLGLYSISTGNGEFGNYIPLTAVFIPWLSSRVDGLFRTQRRRVPGVGV